MAAAGCARAPREAPETPAIPVPVERAPVEEPEHVFERGDCERIERINVQKAERRLYAHCQDEVVLSFRVALGRLPEGPKRRVGDLRTPEGRYRVVAEPRASRFHLFIPIDYPGLEDARLARAEGKIGPETFERIAAAAAVGTLPPQRTALGGEIGLHGEGEDWRGRSRELDWTFGCIALPDADIEFIAQRISVGTEVVIHP